MRIALILVLANYAAFGTFVVLRPSAAKYLRERDAVSERGELMVSSADPLTWIAARPLYQWNEWHGGEHPSVKVMECVNLPSLIAAGILTPVVAEMTRASFYYGRSIVRAVLLIWFTTIQWVMIGLAISRVWSKRRNATV